jgi:asparagine synthase (glutamine-hydrolysing)
MRRMCGICGFVDTRGEPPDQALLDRMVSTLAHRGPDGAKASVLASGPEGPTAVLGHTRLAIIDLSDAAGQPLANEDGTVSVVFNGEIYNFKELRRDLQTRGHSFRSTGDTEVIVHAYEEWGDECTRHLDGMFAFAIWDGRRRRILLARDRVGKKPLYYAWDGRRMTFASEIKSLRVCPWVDTTPMWEAVPRYLACGYVPWPDTMHMGIHQLPPGTRMVMESGRLSEPVAYWSPPRAKSGSGRRVSWAHATTRIDELLRVAVERRLVSDVPLGVLLSGGLDSSAIVAIMSELGVRARTFTVSVGDESSYDERGFARVVAEHFGSEHTEIEVRADAASLLERLLWFLDQPFADSSAIPTYLIAEVAREHVTVALTGDGGDEVFGGYERFAAALLADRIPGLVQRGARMGFHAIPRTGSYHDLRRSVERFTDGLSLPVQTRYRGWVTLFDTPTLSRVLSPDLLAETGRADAFASFDRAWGEAGERTLLDRLLYANMRTYLHDDLLVKTDRMTMANSLEARSPLLDTSLIEELASFPASMKVSPLGLKRLLRRAMRDRLPKEILRRRKHGFGVPVGRWFRNELRAPFHDLVLSERAHSSHLLRRDGVSALFAEHLYGRVDHGPKLWALLTLEVWLRTQERPVGDRPPSAPVLLDARVVRP